MTDDQVRIAAFDFLREQTALRGEVLSRSLLTRGFDIEGQRVPMIGPQGIFKPAVLSEMPLTIIRPDYIVEIRGDILVGVDGPMLQHGLKEMDGRPLDVPRADRLQPRREYLEERYSIFCKAS